MPTTLEYFSYIFHFQALMAGPVIFYRDYTDFIHRQHISGTKAVSTYMDTLNGYKNNSSALRSNLINYEAFLSPPPLSPSLSS
jgi:hypothetical protein